VSNHPTPLSIVRSEWIKFRTVRSTVWGVLTLIALTVGFGALISFASAGHYSQRDIEKLSFDPVLRSLSGLFFAQLVVGVIGALAITSEYGSGAIRSTLAAVPRRIELILAKASVLKITIFVIGEAVSFGAFSIGQMIFASTKVPLADRVFPELTHVPSASLGTPGVFLAVFLGGVALTLLALLGFFLGLIMRSTAASISVYVVSLLVLPILTIFLPSNWRNDISKFLPTNLFQGMIATHHSTDAFSPWMATGTLTFYVLVIGAIGLALFSRRDA
jgi:hypothetical protein